MKLFKHKRFLLYTMALQEAFTAILPFFLLSSSITLVYFILDYFHMHLTFFSWHIFHDVMLTFNTFTSVAAIISIAFFLANRLAVSQIMSVLLSLSVVITLLLIDRPAFPLKLYNGFEPITLIAPLLSVFFLAQFYPRLSLRLPMDRAHRHVYKLYDYLPAFFVSYVMVILVYLAGKILTNLLFGSIMIPSALIPEGIQFFMRDLLSQLFWYTGIHGSHMTNALLGKEILPDFFFPNLSFSEFNRLFVTLGGAGAGLALLIALLLSARDNTIRFLAKISIPFVLFNINELLIYPVIVFNRKLLLPFILVPLLNFLAGYLFLQTVSVHFVLKYITWMTPALVNGYPKSGGDLRLVSFQLFLLGVDTAIYIYFLKQFTDPQSQKETITTFRKNLNLREKIQAGRDLGAYIAHREMIEANTQLETLLSTLDEKNLMLYYQPKIHCGDTEHKHFEALIRYNRSGKVIGPFFLDSIEKAGLAPIMDIWVSQRINEDLKKWETEKFFPQISINLHPDTLLDNAAIETIILNLRDKNIIVEIIERSFLSGGGALENLHKLQKNHFKISIDDFGTGYSNLVTIVEHTMHELKLDKVLIDTIESENGYLVCKKIVELSHAVGYKVVAEGVETEEQFQRVRRADFDYIQGFYFAPALPADQIPQVSDYLENSC